MDYRYNHLVFQTDEFILVPMCRSDAGTLRFDVVNKVTRERRVIECHPDLWSPWSLSWAIWPSEDKDSEDW